MKNYLKLAFVMAGIAVAAFGSITQASATSALGGSCIGDRNYDCGETAGGTKLYGTWTEQV